MRRHLWCVGLAVAAVFVPFRTSAGIRYSLAAEFSQTRQPAGKVASRLVETISHLENQLAVTRKKLAEELRVHPNQMLTLGEPGKPAIVSAYISSQLGVAHGSSEHIRLGDTLVIVRREGRMLTIVAEGVVSEVGETYSTINLTHNIAGVKIEDEVYILNNPSTPFWIANIRVEEAAN